MNENIQRIVFTAVLTLPAKNDPDCSILLSATGVDIMVFELIVLVVFYSNPPLSSGG